MVPSNISLIRRDERMAALEREVRGMRKYTIGNAEMAIEEARIRVRKNFWRSNRGRSVVGAVVFTLGCIAGATISQMGAIDSAVNGLRHGLIEVLTPAQVRSSSPETSATSELSDPVPTAAPAALSVEADILSEKKEPATVEVGAGLIPTPLIELGVVPVAPRLPAVRLAQVDEQPTVAAGTNAEEQAVASDLSAAVEKAREKMKASATSKPAARPAAPETGVNVVLPDRGAKADTAKSAEQVSGNQAKSENQTAQFNVVRYLEDSLLVRSGSNVKAIRVGELLPNGQKLLSVDSKGKTFDSK